MPPSYEQPDFASLCAKSKLIRQDFWNLSALFILHSKKEDKIMRWAELKDEVSSLSAKYDRAAAEIWESQSYYSRGFRLFGSVATSVGLSPTDRPGQIKAITDLIPLLKEPQAQASGLKEAAPLQKDEKVRMYTLLGALFYRLIRIRHDYSSMDVAIAQSALSRAIYQLLGLSPINKMDDWIVMKSCQLFHDFITTDNTGARVPYIQDDAQFLDKLKAIIAEATAKAQPIIEQLAYLDFILSVAKTLEDIQSKVLPLLDGLVMSKAKQGVNSSKAILAYLESKDELLDYHRAYLKLVISDDTTEFSPKDTSPDEPPSLDQAIALIKDRIEWRNEYTLLGAYLSVLMRSTSGDWPKKQVKPDKELLHGLLTKVIVTSETRPLDFEARDVGLEYLQQFVGIPEIKPLVDTKCWEHVTYFQREIAQERIKLAPLLEKEREQRDLEASKARSAMVTA